MADGGEGRGGNGKIKILKYDDDTFKPVVVLFKCLEKKNQFIRRIVYQEDDGIAKTSGTM